jgi:deoxycytidine triphosphate deaminase
MPKPENLDWCKTPEEAEQRFRLYVDDDPFPEIESALLGSAAFVKYIKTIGMIHPFRGWDDAKSEIDRDLVKPASYEIRPGGKFFIYNDKDELEEIDLSSPDNPEYIKLPRNSITFVSTEEQFRLPNYIAVRFNLRIKHVHRGLLLGTGPLIDPGFREKILIPLHNLTDTDYYIKLGEGLIWVEFTKTFPTPAHDLYAEFGKPELPGHTQKTLRKFLVAANAGVPIRSSIPKAVVDAQLAAEAAGERAKKLEQQIRAVSIGGLIVLILTLAGLLVPVVSLVQDTATLLRQAQAERREVIDQQKATEVRLQRLCANLKLQQAQKTKGAADVSC